MNCLGHARSKVFVQEILTICHWINVAAMVCVSAGTERHHFDQYRLPDVASVPVQILAVYVCIAKRTLPKLVQTMIEGTAAMIVLEAKQTLRVEHAPVLEIQCLSGVLWITREGDLHDHFIGPGEWLGTARRGLTLATALERSLVRVVERPIPSMRRAWLAWSQRKPVVRTMPTIMAQGAAL